MIDYKTLRFYDRNTEERFNEFYLPLELRILRYAMLLGILTFFLFIPLDYLLYEAATARNFLILRIVISIIVAIGYGLSFSWINTYQQYQFFAIVMAILSFGSTFAFTFFEGVDNFYYYTGNSILIIFVFILLSIRFDFLRFIAIFFIGVHLLMLKLNFNLGIEEFAHQTYGIISIGLISLASNWIIEFQKRQNFLNTELIEEQKEILRVNNLEKDNLLLELKERNQELNVFNYSVSHDLKTPLRNINTFSNLLEKKYENKLDEEGRIFLNFILDGTDKMNVLINDLLTYSKVKQTKLEIANLNMNQLITTIFEEQTKAFEEIPKLSKTNLPNIKGDEILITQVWNNLISNALKYSSKKEEIRLQIGASEALEGVTYFIKDNGVGFDMKYSKRLFEPFSRLHNERDFKGTGVGLSLVYRIVKKHNGKIWAESEPNKGATFYLFLPKGPKTINANISKAVVKIN